MKKETKKCCRVVSKIKQLGTDLAWKLATWRGVISYWYAANCKSVVYEFKCPHCASFCGIPFIKKEYRDEAGLFSKKAKCPTCRKSFQLGADTIDDVLFHIKKKDLPDQHIFTIEHHGKKE